MRLTRSTLHLSVSGRSVTVQGEAYLPGHGSPDFVAFSATLRCWDDGSEISEREKQEILEQIQDEARDSGLVIEVE